ncbi:unnamed protein product [Leptosia nina]|uniref:Uncharacterized protein n=1 Tax=Leptosia nina TaxID=320188 RepID=A0AAV1J593_9NEOP
MSFEVDRFSPAWAHVALCADLTWASEPPDDFILANQRLLAQHYRVSQILQDTTTESSQNQTNHCDLGGKVEYWFRKLMEDPTERNLLPRRRRQYRIPASDDFSDEFGMSITITNGHRSAASERWGPSGARTLEEATLEAKVRSVRRLWQEDVPRSRAPSPPQVTRKMRARRRQPRRLSALAPPPPLYCLDAPAQLVCDPTCKFHFETPKPPLADCQRAISRYSASMQALMRVTAARCPLYRGTNVSRYAPTGSRPLRCTERRCSIWWPKDHHNRPEQKFPKLEMKPPTPEKEESLELEVKTELDNEKGGKENKDADGTQESSKQREIVVEDDQIASTSSAAVDNERKKRLYSTVLSMSPPPINIAAGCIRLSQKLAPGILKLNPKVVLQTRLRTSNVDNKFEELEKEALEQYKGSDESIDSKFQELEKEAVEQYSTSNSNTSCSSGNSGEKNLKSATEEAKQELPKFNKEKSLDSLVIYSQNFPDLNARGHSSVTNLKNSHVPQRGDKKEQSHRPSKASRNIKTDSQRAGSDTDYESRNNKANHKGAMRWTLHVMPPKKRHLSSCVSDFSSDDDMEEPPGSIKDGPCIKNHISGKVKMSAHGAGDLQPIMRKT